MDRIKAAKEYAGVPYEFGGKNPLMFPGYKYEIYPNDLIQWTSYQGSWETLPDWARITILSSKGIGAFKNYGYSAGKAPLGGAYSLGIDCSGLQRMAIIGDPDWAYGFLDVDGSSAPHLYKLFSDENNSKLSIDESKVSFKANPGDFIIMGDKENGATHIAMFLGYIHDKDGKAIGVKTWEAPSTGKVVGENKRFFSNNLGYGWYKYAIVEDWDDDIVLDDVEL